MISASPSANGAASAAADLRKVLAIAGARVASSGLAVPRAFAQFGPDGQLADTDLDSQLRAVIGALIHATAARHEAA